MDYKFGVNNDRIGADCGNCKIRTSCPIFGAEVFPEAKRMIDAQDGNALSYATMVRDGDPEDGPGDYVSGGVVSYLSAVDRGVVSVEDDDKEVLPEFLSKMALLRAMLERED